MAGWRGRRKRRGRGKKAEGFLSKPKYLLLQPTAMEGGKEGPEEDEDREGGGKAQKVFCYI